jgi:AraC-like DNA-binding protein
VKAKPLLKKHLGIACIPAVNQYLAQGRFEGINVTAILTELTIDTKLLDNHSKHISGALFQQVIEALVKQSQNPLFGLHSSRFVRADSYSVLGFISMNCTTFGEAISKIKPFEQLVGDMGVTTIIHGATTSEIRWTCQYTQPTVTRHMVDNCLSSWLTFTHRLIGSSFSPKQVLLQRATPTLALQQQYHTTFNCPVLYNQDVNALVIDNQLLGAPLTKADPTLLNNLESRAQTMVNSLNLLQSTAEKVAMLVLAQLSLGLPKREMIAKQLDISEKMLQRRLQTENTSFLKILDSVRLNQVNEWLNMTGLSLIEISQLSGFAEPRSFYRWFKHKTGDTPRQFETGKHNATMLE